MSVLRENPEEEFVEFVRSVEAGLRVALVAQHGAERGWEATNDALTYAWENWERVRSLDNPAGYLYRVGQRRARRRRLLPTPAAQAVFWQEAKRHPWFEPKLSDALRSLSARQRQVVVLIEAYEFTFRETAGLLGLSRSSVQTHYERGLERLRSALGVGDE